MSRYRLSTTAQADIFAILYRTQELYGAVTRRRYEAFLVTALRDVANDPSRPGSISRPELGEAVRTYHLRHSRNRVQPPEVIVRRPRHLLLYRTIEPGLIGVARILHDAMDIERHAPFDYTGN